MRGRARTLSHLHGRSLGAKRLARRRAQSKSNNRPHDLLVRTIALRREFLEQFKTKLSWLRSRTERISRYNCISSENSKIMPEEIENILNKVAVAAAHHASPSYMSPIDANPDDIERECNQQHEGECDQSLLFNFRMGISISLLLVASAVFLLTVSWALPISFALTTVAALLGIVALCRPGYMCCRSRSQRYKYSKSSQKTLTVAVVGSSICSLLHLISLSCEWWWPMSRNNFQVRQSMYVW